MAPTRDAERRVVAPVNSSATLVGLHYEVAEQRETTCAPASARGLAVRQESNGR